MLVNKVYSEYAQATLYLTNEPDFGAEAVVASPDRILASGPIVNFKTLAEFGFLEIRFEYVESIPAVPEGAVLDDAVVTSARRVGSSALFMTTTDNFAVELPTTDGEDVWVRAFSTPAPSEEAPEILTVQVWPR